MSSFVSPSAISYAAALALPRFPTPSPMLNGTLREALRYRTAKICFTSRKPRDDAADPAVELQSTAVHVKFVKVVSPPPFHHALPPFLC